MNVTLSMRVVRREPMPCSFGINGAFRPAEKRDRTLIVFVHGFRGLPVSTWDDFLDFVDEFECLRHADLLFYGYDSRRHRMQNIVIKFRDDMNAVWTDPFSLGPDAAAALSGRLAEVDIREPPVWDHVHFVAHSLGAVVVRRAVIDCYLPGLDMHGDEHWSRRCTFSFFAPAHSGANVLKLIAATFRIGGLCLDLQYPCLEDLKEGCAALSDLREDYRGLPQDQRSVANALAVILAEDDRVVNPGRFPGDPRPDQIAGKGHIDVCKPKQTFRDPVEKLARIVSNRLNLSKARVGAQRGTE